MSEVLKLTMKIESWKNLIAKAEEELKVMQNT